MFENFFSKPLILHKTTIKKKNDKTKGASPNLTGPYPWELPDSITYDPSEEIKKRLTTLKTGDQLLVILDPEERDKLQKKLTAEEWDRLVFGVQTR